MSGTTRADPQLVFVGDREAPFLRRLALGAARPRSSISETPHHLPARPCPACRHNIPQRTAKPARLEAVAAVRGEVALVDIAVRELEHALGAVVVPRALALGVDPPGLGRTRRAGPRPTCLVWTSFAASVSLLACRPTCPGRSAQPPHSSQSSQGAVVAVPHLCPTRYAPW